LERQAMYGSREINSVEMSQADVETSVI
jgi:hypothetical protein